MVGKIRAEETRPNHPQETEVLSQDAQLRDQITKHYKGGN